MASTRTRHIPLSQIFRSPTSVSGSQPEATISLTSILPRIDRIKKAITTNLVDEVAQINSHYAELLRISTDPQHHQHLECEVYAGLSGIALMNIALLETKLSSISPDVGSNQSSISTILPLGAIHLEEAADDLMSHTLPTLKRHIHNNYSGIGPSHVGFLDTDLGIAAVCLVRILDKTHFSLCLRSRGRERVVLTPDTEGAAESIDILRRALQLAISDEEQDTDDGSEALYGRVGLLYALLRVRQACAKFLSSAGESDIQSTGAWVLDLWKLVSDPNVDKVVRVIVQRGKHGARVYAAEYALGKNVKAPALMWSWHGKRYLGAAHGVAGILQLLLCTPKRISTPYYQEILDTIDWLLDLQDSSGNWPTIAPKTWRQVPCQGRPSELVHWCHGAPGILSLLCISLRLAQANPERFRFTDTTRGSTVNRLSQGIQRAATLVYTHGFLRKGVGLCHGVAGSIFALLAVSDAMDPKNIHSHRPRPATSGTYLEMAVHLAYLATNYRTLTTQGEMGVPDRPFSLYEGAAGLCCAWGEVLNRISLSDWREQEKVVIVACNTGTIGAMPGFSDVLVG